MKCTQCVAGVPGLLNAICWPDLRWGNAIWHRSPAVGTADCRLLSLPPHFPPYLSDNYKNSDLAGMKSGYKNIE